MAADTGSIETGKRADLIMIKLIRGCPVVLAVLSGGRAIACYDYHGVPAAAEDLAWL